MCSSIRNHMGFTLAFNGRGGAPLFLFKGENTPDQPGVTQCSSWLVGNTDLGRGPIIVLSTLSSSICPQLRPLHLYTLSWVSTVRTRSRLRWKNMLPSSQIQEAIGSYHSSSPSDQFRSEIALLKWLKK